MSAATESRAEGQAALAPLAPFAATLRAQRWFAALGRPAEAADAELARTYLAGLGLADLALDWIERWRDAERVIRAPATAAPWWQVEEDARQDLLATIRSTATEPDYLVAMNRVVLAATEAVIGPAEAAAARAGIADPALIRVAAGAATQACHQAALALAAGAPEDHAFTLKFRLYASGRWPLGAVGTRFFLF
ncbi:MAG TPA: hypothetical protein VMV26_01315 [Alphaproteobacteria bacterium]|nr:hypothetical protein [Alphaproteobacteria bacterium]